MLLELGVSLHDATDGHITQDLLNRLRQIRNFKIQRDNTESKMRSFGATGEIKRVG